MASQAPVDVVFVLGGPGAGKGTQCSRIVENFGFVHLSAGDLLRAERKKTGSENAVLINHYIKEGKIVPVEITIELIKQAMQHNVKEGNSQFLVDGFPRNQDNLQGWQKLMSEYAQVHFVLHLECPEKVMETRLLGRNEGRVDDNLESIKKRFTTFVNETKPILETFEKAGKVRTIKADRTVDEVYADVAAVFVAKFREPSSNLAVPSDDSDPKKEFSVALANALREQQGDVEKGTEEKEKEGTKKGRKQFWDLPEDKKKDIVQACVKGCVFNPATDGEGVESVTWSTVAKGVMSFSGGFTTTATEKHKDGKTVVHSCRVNYYGVLEWWETPFHPQDQNMIPPPIADESGGCVMM
jgi:UMP-CMP kinase